MTRISWTVVLCLVVQFFGHTASSADFTDADFGEHVRQLKEKLPHDGFSIVIQKPFVVIGDEPRKTVERRSRETVRWAVKLLKQDYFDKDPEDILDIWLFRDNASYEEHAEALFGTKPTTPYGYYSRQDKALVMNISTGGGTLVHEIVHPFLESNFPDCPAWFNEGLASLYEQSDEEDGHIVGLTNWRLAGLQRSLHADKVPSFEKLCGTSTHEFYHRDKGTNYSQARYLCYYLQERGLLVKFYRTFRKNVDQDRTGYQTLLSILGEDDAEAFQQEWKEFVLELRFDD